MMLCSVSVALSAAAYAPNVDKPVDQSWEDYKAKYKKTYKDADDENARYALFNTAKTRVSELNKLNGKAGHAFGINWSSDRYPQEQFKKGLRKPKDWVPTAPVLEYSEPRRNPASINWRYTEAVTAIKNQGQCGSCWAFSATEAVESQMILGTGGKLAIDLSPQQIASCTPATGKYGCLGCNGGFTEGAYEYIKSSPGLANAFFLRPSALFAEIDSIRNALVARNYFQYLAEALGLRPFKVWLSTLGIRSSVPKRMALLKTAMPLTAAKPRQ